MGTLYVLKFKLIWQCLVNSGLRGECSIGKQIFYFKKKFLNIKNTTSWRVLKKPTIENTIWKELPTVYKFQSTSKINQNNKRIELSPKIY